MIAPHPRWLFPFVLLATASLAPAQLARWTFDDPGSPDFVANSGSLGALFDLRTFKSTNLDPLVVPATTVRANLQSTNTPGGVGLSLDLTAGGAMKAAQGSYGNLAAPSDAVSGLTAMTITGWFNARASLSSGVQLIRANSAGNNGWVLSFNGARQMRLNIGDGFGATNFNSLSTAFADAPDTWQFFAVSWDSASGGQWYAGGPALAATPAGGSTVLAQMNVNPYQLAVGRSGSGAGTAFYGYLDDVRIYASALDASEIEAIRLSNLGGTTPAEGTWADFRTEQGLPSDGSQDVAEPAGDGVANLLKFAFNMIGDGPGQAPSLTTPNSAPLAPDGAAGLPVLGTDSSGRLTLTYVRRRDVPPAPGIGYAVEFADALGAPTAWAVNPEASEDATVLDDVFERVVVTDSAPVSTRRFARLRVTVQ